MTNAIKGPRTILGQGDGAYPERLSRILGERAPETLYVTGDAARLSSGGLAVTGARKCTPYGVYVTREAVCALGRDHVMPQIVTGGARGIDSCAVEEALMRGIPVVLVVAGGVEPPYPECNAGLFQRVVDAGGTIVSEQPFGAKPTPHMFRARGRILTALADAVLVTECGVPSGTFATCDEAIAQNVPVFAVPGEITSPASVGANGLIAAGAHVVTNTAFLLDCLRKLNEGPAEGPCV